MFQLNDVLVYGTNGVCRITDIKKVSFSGVKPRLYYILTPVYSTQSTLYIPAENEELLSKLRYVLSRDELNDMLSDAKTSKFEWDDNDRTRAEKSQSIVNAGMSSELLTLIKDLMLHREELKVKVKRLHAADEKVLTLSERIASEEFASAFEMPITDATAFLESELCG